MHILLILQLLMLLTLANGAPVIAKKVSGGYFAFPLDFGVTFFDDRPLFGSSKTLRGIAAAVLATTVIAPLVGFDLMIGAIVAGAAMAGDLFSSFVKRRMNLAPSSQAIGLDQIPESLFPMVACRDVLSLNAVDIALGVLFFFVGEIVLSRLLFCIHLRDRPY